MFEIATDFLKQLFEVMPYIIVIYIVFDFLGSFFFGRS